MVSTERMILRNLIFSKNYTQKVLPFLKSEFFIDPRDKLIFDTISGFIDKYANNPSCEALKLIIEDKKEKNLSEALYKTSLEFLEEVSKEKEQDAETDEKWLIDTTEKFCRDKSLYNAVVETIAIMDGKSQKSEGIIPELLTNALAVSFDPNVGHDYIENAEDRYEFYNRIERRIPVGLKSLSKITRGGFPIKTLNVILAGVGVGKTLAMCHLAADFLSQGHNVLYLTMEMAQERIAERIDANLMDVPVNDIMHLSKENYFKKIDGIKNKTTGKLIIKEYPTAGAGVMHFKALLNELYLKKNFRPAVIFVDYLNICLSTRFKAGNANMNSYTYVKGIAEELRGLAVEFSLPVFTATQLTRQGYGDSDPDITSTSESFGVPATADFMAVIVTNEEMARSGRILFKQLKNRYNGIDTMTSFMLGIDRPKMKLYDINDQEVDGPQEVDHHTSARSVMDNSDFGKKFNAEKFGGLK